MEKIFYPYKWNRSQLQELWVDSEEFAQLSELDIKGFSEKRYEEIYNHLGKFPKWFGAEITTAEFDSYKFGFIFDSEEDKVKFIMTVES